MAVANALFVFAFRALFYSWFERVLPFRVQECDSTILSNVKSSMEGAYRLKLLISRAT